MVCLSSYQIRRLKPAERSSCEESQSGCALYKSAQDSPRTSTTTPSPPAIMSSITTSSPNFQSILDAAFDSYAKQTGIDLTKHPFADKLQNCRSSSDVLQILSERELAFKDHRDQYRNLIDRVRPVVQVIHAFSAVLSGASRPVSSGTVFALSGRISTPNRCSNQRKRYSLASMFFSQYVSTFFFPSILM